MNAANTAVIVIKGLISAIKVILEETKRDSPEEYESMQTRLIYHAKELETLLRGAEAELKGLQPSDTVPE